MAVGIEQNPFYLNEFGCLQLPYVTGIIATILGVKDFSDEFKE